MNLLEGFECKFEATGKKTSKEKPFRKRVYVVGAITPRGDGNPVLEYGLHWKRFLEVSQALICRGYAPFNPILDFPYTISGAGVLTPDDFYEVSLSFMSVCDAILLIEQDAEKSVGVRKELEIADKLGIRVFTSIERLHDYFTGAYKI